MFLTEDGTLVEVDDRVTKPAYRANYKSEWDTYFVYFEYTL